MNDECTQVVPPLDSNSDIKSFFTPGVPEKDGGGVVGPDPVLDGHLHVDRLGVVVDEAHHAVVGVAVQVGGRQVHREVAVGHVGVGGIVLA